MTNKIDYTKVRSVVAKQGGCEVQEVQSDGTLGAPRFISTASRSNRPVSVVIPDSDFPLVESIEVKQEGQIIPSIPLSEKALSKADYVASYGNATTQAVTQRGNQLLSAYVNILRQGLVVWVTISSGGKIFYQQKGSPVVLKGYVLQA